MRVAPLDQDIEAGRRYLNERMLQIGHVLPLSDELFREYFPARASFLIYSGRGVDALFSYQAGREKWRPRANFVLVTDSLPGLKEAVSRIEDTAVTQEKLVVRTRVFGYDRKRLQALKILNYKIGASIPDAVSLDGKRFELHYLYKELDGRYKVSVRKDYAKPGLYPIQAVEKAKNQRLRIRGYRKEDRAFLDKSAQHLNVIRGIAHGVFAGSLPWAEGGYHERLDKRQTYPIVCEDESIGEPVGLLDLSKQDPDVMQHLMVLGMYVRAEYQGLGVGSMLIESAKTLAMRLNLSGIVLTVFEGNEPARRLYRKAGFTECGRIPGYLQEGYVNEIYMILQLD